ncbi:MAG: beta-ketoacyl-ACP reductase [Conexivisphaerales archaeon]
MQEKNVAIVTGSARGIGRAIANKLATKGIHVALGDIDPAVVEVGKQISEQTGSKLEGFVVDVKDYNSCSNFYRNVLSAMECDHVDILVNNAGINRDALFVNMTEQQWDEVIKVDLYSIFNCTKQVVPGMIKVNHGRIVNVSSMSWLGNVGQANYSAAKAGVIGFTKTLSKELARYNITVNAVCPGFIDTPMTRAVPENIRQKFLDRIPMRRIGLPEDVANFVSLLVSEEASYVTGEVINISGGMTI